MAASVQSNPLVDSNIVNGLRGLSEPGKPDFLNELIELYKKRAPIILVDILNSHKEGNQEEFEKSSHSLKGTSANIGADYIRAVCEEMEVAGREGRLKEEVIVNHVANIASYLKETMDELDKWVV